MNWRNAESTVRPAELDTISSSVVNYIRKDIQAEQVEQDDGNTIIMYKYKELEVMKKDWDLFTSLNDSQERLSDIEDAVIELAELIGG